MQNSPMGTSWLASDVDVPRQGVSSYSCMQDRRDASREKRKDPEDGPEDGPAKKRKGVSLFGTRFATNGFHPGREQPWQTPPPALLT